jgi:hypothetical protein
MATNFGPEASGQGTNRGSDGPGDGAFWHAQEGWGAIEAADRAGLGFAHWSKVRVDRALVAGEPVE